MHLQKKRIIFNGVEYLIYSDGRIFGPTGVELSQRPNHDGYATVTLGSKKKGRRRVFVHRLVAELFLENPNNFSDVDHLDSNRMNPSVDNLEWVTHQENIRRAYERGGHLGRAVGMRNPRAGLCDELVLLMRKLYKNGTTIQEMVEKYGYPWTTISNAVKGVTWKRLVTFISKEHEVKEVTGTASKGSYNLDTGIICVRSDLDYLQKIKTLLHEYAHAMDFKMHPEPDVSRNRRELIAESVAFVVAMRLGLDTSSYSMSYIKSWLKDADELKIIADTVQKVSARIINNLAESSDSAFSNLMEDEE